MPSLEIHHVWRKGDVLVIDNRWDRRRIQRPQGPILGHPGLW